MPGGGRAIVKLAPAAKCEFCRMRPHTKLCDFPAGPGKTCDAKMCDRCATHVGRDLDNCPRHAHFKPPAQGTLGL
jgi:hypothetical protein